MRDRHRGPSLAQANLSLSPQKHQFPAAVKRKAYEGKAQWQLPSGDDKISESKFLNETDPERISPSPTRYHSYSYISKIKRSLLLLN